MIKIMDSNGTVSESGKCVDSQLWHACAGSMVQMPVVNTTVFYFPQGHAEHASAPVDFRAIPQVPAYILCKVSSIKFMADPDTDEVYTSMKLTPINNTQQDFLDGKIDEQEKPSSFAKTLTQSDANNGGGFSVPRYCAETIFPRLDYTADPPVQTILARDVHGETWKFRHIYRGTPRRHLLTTGWSNFVNHKKLVAGDSIVFLRSENGDLCVGIRRAKRGPEWIPCGGFSPFLREGVVNQMVENGRVAAGSVIEAVKRAVNGEVFEVVYYPRASRPEFCVKAGLVKAALQTQWCPEMRFKMAFETEDSSRISWFMGTISSVEVSDPIRWPDSPWRLLEIVWDEPDLLQSVKRVSPWLVELVSSMPSIHLSQQRKKLKSYPDHLGMNRAQLAFPMFVGCGGSSPFGCCYTAENNSPAGMQGARHTHYGLPISDIHFNKLHSGVLHNIQQKPSSMSMSEEEVSCLLTMSNSIQNSKRSCDEKKRGQFVLFGQVIEPQNSNNTATSFSSDSGNVSEGSQGKTILY